MTTRDDMLDNMSDNSNGWTDGNGAMTPQWRDGVDVINSTEELMDDDTDV